MLSFAATRLSKSCRRPRLSEVGMKPKRNRRPPWFVPAVILAAAGAGGALALLIAGH